MQLKILWLNVSLITPINSRKCFLSWTGFTISTCRIKVFLPRKVNRQRKLRIRQLTLEKSSTAAAMH